MIGGYRLVRKLGSGHRADVFLGHAGDANEGPDRTSAVKVYRPSASRAGIDLEIEALARASSPHLVRLDDLAMAPDGRPVLILERLGSVTIGQLLVRRGAVSPGEAVTILAPLAAAVAELHRVGVAHRRLRPGSVLFDEIGAPVLAAFGHAVLVGAMPDRQNESSMSPAALGECQEVIGDLVDLAALSRAVVELTQSSKARTRVLDWLDGNAPQTEPDRFANNLSEVLFDSAEAASVDLDGPRRVLRLPPPARTSAPVETGTSRPRPGSREAHSRQAAPPNGLSASRRPDWLAAVHLPEWLDAARFGTSARRVGASARRRLCIAGAIAAVLSSAALLAMPSPTDPLGTAGSAIPEPGVPEGADPVEADPAVLADDPIPAAVALLALRNHCIEARSVLCLDEVDQPGSAAWEADSHVVRRLQDGSTVDQAPLAAVALNIGEVELIERMGDSALLAVTVPGSASDTAPASLLLMKGESGWRIRDLIAE
ncbi:MAG TPA: protein kinase [Marisediminicola sp.]|jgi:serine/threonine protein kinase|nr:protein kinase [Marisediminicola sp.]